MNFLKFHPDDVETIVDPTTGSGDVSLFPDALGQEGRPFVLFVKDPPNKTRARHYHHGDVIYFYVQGEHYIEGERMYKAGDVRWTKAGYAYGPETTGPEGGAWWVVSYADPIPVEIEDGRGEVQMPVSNPEVADMPPSESFAGLPRLDPPYDWSLVDEEMKRSGAVILSGYLTSVQVETLNAAFDRYLDHRTDEGYADTGSSIYDLFLGQKTLRLHGLVEKIPETAELIADEQIVQWAERVIGPVAGSVLMNAGELIEIRSDESTQYLHRDTDSWKGMDIGEAPICVNAIYALDRTTLENGATHVAPGSWKWDVRRQPTRDELIRAEMNPGDVLLFRADLLHGGGANLTSARRRCLSVTYCAGWLRPVENSFLNIPNETARTLAPRLRALLGYEAYNGTQSRGGLLGLYEGGDPGRALGKQVR